MEKFSSCGRFSPESKVITLYNLQEIEDHDEIWRDCINMYTNYFQELG